MGSIFSGPKMPDPGPAPTPPESDADKAKKRDAEAYASAQRYASGGKASTYLTSPLGVTSQEQSFASRLLLG